ncbi:uncharacterized protein BKA78DRAFT_367326 [Phyllosticta capitalensis]|uniref:uncharacterized protein n=1 Tax=Phyllosticta capitalensis TaxID=121624 RepID=UPI003130E1F4
MDGSGCRAATEQGFFGKLPAELRLEIFKRLDYGSVIFLAATNHYRRRQIDPLTLVPEHQKMDFITQAQEFKRHKFELAESRTLIGSAGFGRDWSENEGFACGNCFRVKKTTTFPSDELPKVDFDIEEEEIEKPPPYRPFLGQPPTRLCKDCKQILEKPRTYADGSRAWLIKWLIFREFIQQIKEGPLWYWETCEERQVKDTRIRANHFGCSTCRLCFWTPPQIDSCPQCNNKLVEGMPFSFFRLRNDLRRFNWQEFQERR